MCVISWLVRSVSCRLVLYIGEKELLTQQLTGSSTQTQPCDNAMSMAPVYTPFGKPPTPLMTSFPFQFHTDRMLFSFCFLFYGNLSHIRFLYVASLIEYFVFSIKYKEVYFIFSNAVMADLSWCTQPLVLSTNKYYMYHVFK